MCNRADSEAGCRFLIGECFGAGGGKPPMGPGFCMGPGSGSEGHCCDMCRLAAGKVLEHILGLMGTQLLGFLILVVYC